MPCGGWDTQARKNQFYIILRGKHFRKQKMKIILAVVLILFLLNFHWLNAEELTASFESRLFCYLNITPVQRTFVGEFIDCSFACLRNVLCASFNVAVFASDGGKRWCELLPSNSHNNVAKLTEKQQSHHYSLTFKVTH